jgi:uroporphyrinogen III methyltransferase/synthase
MDDAAGRVFLVGAGPGAPDLITVRGARVLGAADVVVYDSLVSAELLKLAPAAAERIHAGKRGGDETSIDQEAINRMLVERARAGQKVVRLKGGDPFIFGRGGEEAEALARAGVAFEVVPGVTSAIAVPAFAGIPVTHRDHGSFVVIVTGHEEPTRERVESIPWDDLARAAGRRGTLVILMAAARMGPTLARLAAAGIPASSPAAAIQWGATAAQRTVLATVATLADAAEQNQLAAPAILVIGECAGLREDLAWFEKLPLFGRRIVVTRAIEQNAEFAAGLRALGAEVIEFPTIAIAPPSSYAQLDQAIREAAAFDWIIFTSARGVNSFIERLRVIGCDLRNLGEIPIAAIGPMTAARVCAHALTVAAMPSEYRAEAIIDAIGPARIAGARILIPRAEVAREILPQLLTRHGAREVVVAPVYRTVLPVNPDVHELRERLASGAIDLVTFTSASTVHNFCAMVGAMIRSPKAAAIGPITAAAARERGFEVIASPARYTVADLTAAVVAHFAAPRLR